MYDDFDSIKLNKYINNLEEAAENFGLSANYIDFKSSTDQTVNSIYFVVGNNLEKITSSKVDIEKINRKIGKDPDFLYIDYNVFELTDNPSFATHQYVLSFCRKAEFVREVFKEHGMNPPEKIDKRFLLHLINLYKEKEKHGKDSFYGDLYEDAFNRYVGLQDKLLGNNNLDFKGEKGIKKSEEIKRKAQLELYGLIEKNTKVSFFSKFVNNRLYDNFCTLEDLSERSNNLVKHKIKAKYLEGLSEKLADTNISCWHSDIEYQPNTIIDQESGVFKSKKLDDDSVVCLRYDELDANEITRMLIEIAYPEIAETDISDIVNGPSITVAMRELDLEYFKKLCDKNGVKFGFDPDRIYNRGFTGPINIIVSKNDKEKLTAILDYIAEQTEKFHTHNLGLPTYEFDSEFETITSLSNFEIEER